MAMVKEENTKSKMDLLLEELHKLPKSKEALEEELVWKKLFNIDKHESVSSVNNVSSNEERFLINIDQIRITKKF